MVSKIFVNTTLGTVVKALNRNVDNYTNFKNQLPDSYEYKGVTDDSEMLFVTNKNIIGGAKQSLYVSTQFNSIRELNIIDEGVSQEYKNIENHLARTHYQHSYIHEDIYPLPPMSHEIKSYTDVKFKEKNNIEMICYDLGIFDKKSIIRIRIIR